MAAGPPPAGATPSNTSTTPVPESTPPVAEGGTPAAPPPSTQAAAGHNNADDGVGLGEEGTKAELKRAREEAAKYRTQLRKFEAAFEGYDEADIDKALAMYRAIEADPKQAHKSFKEVVANIEQYLRENDEWEEGDPIPAEVKGEKPLTAKQVEKMMADRERKQAEEKAIQTILKDAEALGYKEGTWKHQTLLFIAAKDPAAKSDVKLAHAIFESELEEYGKGAVQKYIDSLGKGGKPPVTSGSPGGPAASGAGAPAASPDPKKSALARLTAAGF